MRRQIAFGRKKNVGFETSCLCKQRCAYPPPKSGELPFIHAQAPNNTHLPHAPETRGEGSNLLQKPCCVCDKIKGRCCFLDNKVRSAVCGLCIIYICISELTLYVHAPANCENTALAELTASWQSCYRRRRRRRCCCCCCCCFRFSPQKRQTHLKPLITASFTCATVLTSSVPRLSL